MNARWRPIGVALLTASFAAPLLAHGYIGSYSRFIADDYCYAYVTNSMGVLEGAAHWYITWTGRFSANVLDTILHGFGPSIAQLAPPVVLAMWLCALTIATLQVMPGSAPAPTRRWVRGLTALLLAALIVFTTLEISPVVEQSLYWLLGITAYVIPLVLASLLVTVIGFYPSRDHRGRDVLAWSVTVGSLAFMAAGFSETYAIVQTSTLLFLALAAALSRRAPSKGAVTEYLCRIFPLLLASLCASFLAVMVVLAAPGNEVRGAYFAPPSSPLSVARISLESTLSFVGLILRSRSDIVTLLGLLFLSTLAGAMLIPDGMALASARHNVLRALVGIPVGLLLLLVSCFVPSAYALSAAPPQRALIVPAFVLVCGIVLWGCLLGGLFARDGIATAVGPSQGSRSLGRGQNRQQMLLRVGICLACIVFALNGLRIAYRTAKLQPVFSSYAMAWDEVDSMIRRAKLQNVSSVTVPQLRNWAGLRDLSYDPQDWLNKCVADYYGLTVIADSAP